MATILTPSTATPKPVNGDLRAVSVRAWLLPDEIISARQVKALRKQVLIGLVVVVVLLIGWFGLSKWQTSSANSNLHRAHEQGVSLQDQQSRYAPLVEAQTQITSIKSQLQTLMTGDLSWKTMLTTLQSKAPRGVAFDSVNGIVTAGGAAVPGSTPAGSTVLNMTGKPTVGQLTITGTAPDKRSVAAFSDALATVPGLTAPLISNVTVAEKTVKFSVSVVITSDALGGRYAAATTSLAGGN